MVLSRVSFTMKSTFIHKTTDAIDHNGCNLKWKYWSVSVNQVRNCSWIKEPEECVIGFGSFSKYLQKVLQTLCSTSPAHWLIVIAYKSQCKISGCPFFSYIKLCWCNGQPFLLDAHLMIIKEKETVGNLFSIGKLTPNAGWHHVRALARLESVKRKEAERHRKCFCKVYWVEKDCCTQSWNK